MLRNTVSSCTVYILLSVTFIISITLDTAISALQTQYLAHTTITYAMEVKVSISGNVCMPEALRATQLIAGTVTMHLAATAQNNQSMFLAKIACAS